MAARATHNPEKKKSIDLILSHFNEGLQWMSWMPIEEFDHIYIYDKGPNDLETPKEIPAGKCSIIKLDNVGKCDHSYLYHIIHNYDNLADINVFLPANCDHVDKIFNTMATLSQVFRSERSSFVCHEYEKDVPTSMFGMLFDSYESRDKRNKEIYPSAVTRASPIRPFGLWYSLNFPGITIHHCCYQGIFAVERKHVHQRDRASYAMFIQYVDNHPNPEVGHYLERTWLALFHPVPEECIHVMPNNQFIRLQLNQKHQLTRQTVPAIELHRPRLGFPKEQKQEERPQEHAVGTTI
jgi:hypothetical protein